MRKGTNPEKFNKEILIENYHRVIVPVFIPHFDGYFAQLLDVFKLCLESLLLTSHTKTRITIYNNNSHSEVKKYINSMYSKSEMIDQVFHSKINLGKINAILSASKGNLEPLITITDADVLFKNGWQEEVEKVFIGFPKAGMVSPVPSSKAFKNFTSNNWYYGFFNGKLVFEDVIDPIAMNLFDLSLGRDTPYYNSTHLQKYLVLKNKKESAVMGCGHFVATLKREVFDKGTTFPANIKIDGGVEYKFIDAPNENLGFLRLATKGNYAFHMGNNTEPWMYDEFNLLKDNKLEGCDLNRIKYDRVGKIGIFIGRIFIKLLNRKKIKKAILKYLGLKEVSNY